MCGAIVAKPSTPGSDFHSWASTYSNEYRFPTIIRVNGSIGDWRSIQIFNSIEQHTPSGTSALEKERPLRIRASEPALGNRCPTPP